MARQGGLVAPVSATFQVKTLQEGGPSAWIDVGPDGVTIRLRAGTLDPVEVSIDPEAAPLFRMVSNRLDEQAGKRQAGGESKREKPKGEEDSSPVLMLIPCSGNGPKEWPLTEARMKDWQDAFPAIDVRLCLRQAVLWLRNNPRNAKTFVGMPRLFTSWLSREQNKAPRQGFSNANRTPAFFANNDDRYLESGSAPAPVAPPSGVPTPFANLCND
jgi:hypothetical protein